MISKKDIHDYDFNSIEEYFNYIIDLITNAKKEQAVNLIRELSKAQRLDAYRYYTSAQSGEYSEFYDNVKKMLIQK